MSELVLSVGKARDGRLLAIVTTGGHPQINPNETTIVLAVEVVQSQEEANEWFEKAQIERPWITRQ